MGILNIKMPNNCQTFHFMDGQRKWYWRLLNILVKGCSFKNLLVATKCFNPTLFAIETSGDHKEMQALVGRLKYASYFASYFF